MPALTEESAFQQAGPSEGSTGSSPIIQAYQGQLTFCNGAKLWRIRKWQSLAAPPSISSHRQIVQEPILDMIDSLQNRGLLSGSYLCCWSSCNSYINFVLVGHVNNEICELNFAAQFTPLLLFCLQCIVFWEYCLSKNKKLVRTSSG